MHHLVEGANHGGNPLLYLLLQRRVGGRKIGFLQHLLLNIANPPVENQAQRPALRLCLGGHIADKLLVGGKSLASSALQPPLRGQVGIHHHKILRHHIVADGLQQEALAAAILAHNEAERSAALGNHLHIPQQGINLRRAPHGHIVQSHPRHHAALEGIHQRLGNSLWYLHGLTISFSSSI